MALVFQSVNTKDDGKNEEQDILDRSVTYDQENRQNANQLKLKQIK